MKKLLTLAFVLTTSVAISAQTWLDVTQQYVVNPNFDGNIEGWTDSFDNAAQNHGYQGASYWNEESFLNQFAEAWRPNDGWWQRGRLGNASIQQTIANIPAGKYRLEADAIAVNQGEDYENPVTGVLLFIKDTAGESTMVMATNNSAPEHFTVEYTTRAKSMTIGVRTQEATANWMAFDNIKLYYWGSEVKITGITLNQTTAKVTQGQQLQLTATITPENATFRGITFSSSNETVATVDENGLVTARKPGITTITVSATEYPDIQARCIITVEENQVSAKAVVINEIQQSNVDMFLDPSFNFGGWIELYNNTETDVALDGLYISDGQGHRMALNSALHGYLPAKGFCTLWFDHYSWWTPKTINFKLDCDGGRIAISNEQGIVLSQFDYPPAITRTSYARTTDGGNIWGYTDQPTPGASNATSSFSQIRLEAPLINIPGGLFTNRFTAQVTNIPTGATIRYTTDGSTPTLDNGETSSNGRFTISNTTILRVRFFKEGYLSSAVATRSYLLKNREFTLPIISIVSDEANLTGADYGIFARGNGNGRPGNGQSGNCNWNMSWDRPINMEYIDEQGNAVFSQEMGIEVSGGWSRAWAPQSFNVKANKIYEGINRLDFQFFKNKPYLRHKGLKVRNGGNDYNSGRIKDAALQEVISTAGLYVETQSYQPVHLYRNGQYIGILNLREPNNKHYAYANYGIGTDDEEMDQWKMSPDSNYVQQVGTKDVFNEWYTLSQNANDALTYERIKQIVDIEEMCNYLAVQLYLCGNDWPKNNIKAFRARTQGESNSRFRAVLFDLDHAFNNGTNEFNWFFENSLIWTFDQLYGAQVIAKYGNRITSEIELVTIITNMLKNEDFKKQFIDQFCIVAGSVFEPERSSEIVQALIDRVAADGHNANSGYDVMSQLSSSRQTATVNNMRNYFRLAAPKDITLASNISEARLLINGLNVPTGKFSGLLFDPITITTAAPAGYKFLGWRSNQSVAGKTVIGRGSEWEYYDQGSLDESDWTATNYDHSGWSKGKAPLGYFVTDASNSRGYQTFLNYGNNDSNKYPTYYFRKEVTITSTPKSSESFDLNWTADDGFIIYVNGVEAGRYLMPAGDITFNTFSTTYAHDNPDSGTMQLQTSLFKRGTNTIAVEVHNNAANSTDIYWDAELIYNKESDQNIVSAEASFAIPSSTSSATYTAIYEKMSDTDEEAWDAHPIKINEVSAANDIYVNDLFKKSDWIELYNTTDADIDIEGMYLSDHLEEPEKWQITADNENINTIIPAHGHLIVWADKNAGINQVHADFKLNNEDSCLILLTAADKSWADTLVYCRHDGFHSVGLFPDGGSDIYVMERPTIGTANVLTTEALAWNEPTVHSVIDQIGRTADERLLAISFDGQAITLHASEAARLDIFSPSGQLMHTARIRPSVPHALTALQRGIYVARATIGDEETTLKFTIQ